MGSGATKAPPAKGGSPMKAEGKPIFSSPPKKVTRDTTSKSLIPGDAISSLPSVPVSAPVVRTPVVRAPDSPDITPVKSPSPTITAQPDPVRSSLSSLPSRARQDSVTKQTFRRSVDSEPIQKIAGDSSPKMAPAVAPGRPSAASGMTVEQRGLIIPDTATTSSNTALRFSLDSGQVARMLQDGDSVISHTSSHHNASTLRVDDSTHSSARSSSIPSFVIRPATPPEGDESTLDIPISGDDDLVLQNTDRTTDPRNEISLVNVPEHDTTVDQDHLSDDLEFDPVDSFDQYHNIRTICVQAPRSIRLAAELTFRGSVLPRQCMIHRIDDHVWFVAWCPGDGDYLLNVKGHQLNDLASVAVFDEDAEGMETQQATSTSDQCLSFHITCPVLEEYTPPPPPQILTAARDFNTLILVPTESPLVTDTNEVVLPVIAPANVLLHAELFYIGKPSDKSHLELLEEQVIIDGMSPIRGGAFGFDEPHRGDEMRRSALASPRSRSTVPDFDDATVGKIVDSAWTKYGTGAEDPFALPAPVDRSGAHGGIIAPDVSRIVVTGPGMKPPLSPDQEEQMERKRPPQFLGDAWVRWRRNIARFNENGMCTATLPHAGQYRLNLSVKRHLSAMGAIQGINIAENGDQLDEEAPSLPVRSNAPSLELLSSSPIGARIAALQRAPPSPSLTVTTAGTEDSGWTQIASYIVLCNSDDTRSEPAHTYEPFGALGMWLSQHVPYRIEADQNNNSCQTILQVPPAINVACQLRKGGIVYGEGWVRVHRMMDSTTVVIDTTVPEKGKYQLSILGSGPGTDNKYRQAMMQEITCESDSVCEAPAAVGELFQAIGLELDSHVHTLIVADEYNKARISLLVPTDLNIEFKAQLRNGEATLPQGWVQISRDKRDNKVFFEVSLPRPGMYKLLLSASVEGTPYNRILTHYIEAQADYSGIPPVAVPSQYQAMGVVPVSHPYSQVTVKDGTPLIITWSLPEGMTLKATVKEGKSVKFDSSYITFKRAGNLVDCIIDLPPLLKKPTGRAFVLPTYDVKLFVKSEMDVGFNYLTGYNVQMIMAGK